MRYSIHRWLVLCLAIALLAGCGSSAVKKVDLVWPLPPEKPRVRWLQNISRASDISQSSVSKFKESILGKEDEVSLMKPYGLCTDRFGKLYVADTGSGRVFVFDLNATSENDILKFIGESGQGKLLQPIDVAVSDSGDIFITDSKLNTVYCFGKDYSFKANIGPGEFGRPTGIAYDRKNNRIFILDTVNHMVKVFDTQGNKIAEFGKGGEETGEFNRPTNIKVDKNGYIYITDTMNGRIQIFDENLNFVSTFGSLGQTAGTFARPRGIGIDTEGHIYVVDAGFDNVQIFDQQGNLLLFFGQPGFGPGEFWLPAGMYIDENDRIYVADSYNQRVEIFQYLSDKDSKSSSAEAGGE